MAKIADTDYQRVVNSSKNLVVSVISQILVGVLGFIERTVFIHLLSDEYLGINGLFFNILSFLSLAELGFGSAIVFCLYKPLAENDINLLSAIMNLFRRVYRLIGFGLVLLGFIVTPFLPLIIKSDVAIPHLPLYFNLYVLSSAVTYFASYKTALIEADQKRYIVTMYTSGGMAIQSLLQICILLLTKSYLLYLCVQIVVNIVKYYILSLKADKLYPFLKKKTKERIPNDIREVIVRNVKAMVFHKVGGVTVNSTDNILISSMVGIAMLGLYTNYKLILGAVTMGLYVFPSSISASVGNLCAVESKEKRLNAFDTLNFIGFLLYGFVSICILVLIEPMINLWLGPRYCLGPELALIISINFYLSGMRNVVLVFKDVMGLYWADQYKPIFEALINLIASVILGKYFGLIGILAGTAISTISTCLWVEPLVLYRYGFDAPVWPYFKKYLFYSFFIVCVGALTYWVASLFSFGRIGTFLARLFVCIVVPVACCILVYGRSPKLAPIKTFIRSLFLRIKNQGEK